MRRTLIAVLLSLFVFPGLGQLYKQDQKKGVLLLLGANALFGILLLVSLVLFSREYMAVFYPEPLTREVLASLLKAVLQHPLFLVPFLGLVALWAFAAVDAGRTPGPPPET
jgi:Na+-driven multidrug efflux pump